MDTEIPNPELIFQEMASPAVPIMSIDSDSRMGDENDYSPTYNPGDLAAMAGGISVPSFVWSEPTELATEAISPQETVFGDSSRTIVAFDETLRSTYGYPSGVSCFGCVLRMAIGLSIILAITSLLLLCCLSRRRQYIWIDTVNIVDTRNAIAQQERVQEQHRNDMEPGSLAEERTSSGQDIDGVNEPSIVPEQDIWSIGRSETGGSTAAPSQDIQGPKRSFIPRGWITSVGWPRASLNLDIPTSNNPGVFQRWFGSNPSQFTILKRPGFFQRWFGWKREKHVNFNDAPLYGQRIHSVQTRGSTDPSIILTEVAERLVRERMRQLSTILSIGEEEEAQAAIVGSTEEPETSSMSSIRAVATGSTMGTQRRDNTVRRSRHGVFKAFNDMDGVATSLPVSTISDGTGMQGEIWGEEIAEGEERELKGKSIRSVRFDGSVDNTKGKGRVIFGRTSVRQYLFPTSVDGNLPVASTSGGGIGVNDFVKEKKGDGTGHPWGNISNTDSGNPDNTINASSTLSSATGAELKRQPERGIEVESCGGGSSIGDDSTLTVGSDGNIGHVLADDQLPTEGEVAAVSGFAMGSDLVLSRPMRTQWDTRMIEEVLSDECGVSAFGLRAKSPRWDSQTSNEDSEPGDGELGSGYFTESSSGNDNREGEEGSGPFPPADPCREGVEIEDEIKLHGELN